MHDIGMPVQNMSEINMQARDGLVILRNARKKTVPEFILQAKNRLAGIGQTLSKSMHSRMHPKTALPCLIPGIRGEYPYKEAFVVDKGVSCSIVFKLEI